MEVIRMVHDHDPHYSRPRCDVCSDVLEQGADFKMFTIRRGTALKGPSNKIEQHDGHVCNTCFDECDENREIEAFTYVITEDKLVSISVTSKVRGQGRYLPQNAPAATVELFDYVEGRLKPSIGVLGVDE